MIESLDMHLQDLVQNAYSAGASRVSVLLDCDKAADRLTLEVSDNGSGMDEQTMRAVQQGFFSSKSKRSVGLGIPLLRASAEHCDGSFDIASRPGAGTTVTARFRLRHIDLPQLGNLAKTFLNILVTSSGRWVSITYRCGDQELDIDTNRLHEFLGETSFQHPEVIRFLRSYIEEHIGQEWEET